MQSCKGEVELKTASEPNSHYAPILYFKSFLYRWSIIHHLTASDDRAHLNFIHLSNLYNAHKLRKVQSHCTIDGEKVCLKGQKAEVGLVPMGS